MNEKAYMFLLINRLQDAHLDLLKARYAVRHNPSYSNEVDRIIRDVEALISQLLKESI